MFRPGFAAFFHANLETRQTVKLIESRGVTVLGARSAEGDSKPQRFIQGGELNDERG